VLAFYALNGLGSALRVIHGKAVAFVVAEIKLAKVALQVLRAGVVIRTGNLRYSFPDADGQGAILWLLATL